MPRSTYTFLLTAVALTVLSTGCAVLGSQKKSNSPATASAGQLQGWLIPSEIIVDGNGLHYTGYLNNVPAQATVEVSLTDPDGVTKLLYQGNPPGVALGDVTLESGSTTRMKVGVGALEAGALKLGSYSLSLHLGGQELDRADFELISVRDLMGGTRLQVSPKGPAIKPYLQRKGLTIWLSKTAADDMPSVRAYWFTDGVSDGDSQNVFSRPIGIHVGQKNFAHAELVASVPYVFRTPSTRTGHHEVVLVAADTILGAATFSVRSVNGKTVIEGLETEKRAGNYGALTPSEPSPSAREHVEAILLKIGPSPARTSGWTERTYCAFVENEKARELAATAIRAKGANATDPRAQIEVDMKSADPKVRKSAKERLKHFNSIQRGRAGVGIDSQAALQAIAAGYEEGCLRKLLPPAFAETLIP